MLRRTRWLVLVPVVLIAFGTTMVSCGGGSSCGGSFDSFGNFVPGACPGATPSPGFTLEDLILAAGSPILATPTPTPGGKKTPTPTLSPEPTATSTGITIGGYTLFNAQGVLVKGKQTQLVDKTNGATTVWTSSDQTVLFAPLPGMGGEYQGAATGCACVQVSADGVTSQRVTVGVDIADLTTCPICATPSPTPTPAPAEMPMVPHLRSSPTGAREAAASGPAAAGGVEQFAFDAGSRVRGAIIPGASGTVYFITRDSKLYAVDSHGREIYYRPAGGLAPAVAPDGTVYVQGTTDFLYALKADGNVAWMVRPGAGNGPLAADDSAVYSSAGGDLIAASAPGEIEWRAAVGSVTSGEKFSGGIVVGAEHGDVTAVSTSGGVLWRFAPEGGFAGTLAVTPEAILAASQSGILYALDPENGTVIWRFATGAPIDAGPSVSGTGAIYVGSDALYGLSADGERTLRLIPAPAPFALVGDALGGFFDIDQSDLATLRDSAGHEVWSSRSFGAVDRVAVAPSGMLYIAATNGYLYALK
jgi:outer membrane protein assembly factor BamB